MKKKPANALIVADTSWAADIPRWLLEEVAAERLVLGLAELMDKHPAQVGDAEACVYLMTSSLRAPLRGPFTEIYIWLTAVVMKRHRGGELPEFVAAKFAAGLTRDEQFELGELKTTLHHRRGRISHPVLDAMRQLKKQVPA